MMLTPLSLAINRQGKMFLLSDLYASGESGFLANPLITYQDTGTTTISDDPGEAVGHILSQPGPVTPLDPTQGTSSAKPVWAVAPFGGIKNLLAAGGIGSESLTNATLTNVTNVGAVGTQRTVQETTASGVHAVSTNTAPVISGTTYTFFFVLKRVTDDWMQLSTLAAGFDEAATWQNFDIATGTIVGANKGASAVAAIQAHPTISGAYICMIQAVANETSASSGWACYFTNNANSATRAPSYAGDTGSQTLVGQVMMATGARDIAWYIANYQTVTTASNVTQSGIISVPWIYGTTDDWMDFGAVGFGTATQGFYAAAGQNWSLVVRYCGFGNGMLAAQCGATAGDRMFSLEVLAGTVQIRLRGTLTDSAVTVTDGVPHLIAVVCTNGVVTMKIDTAAWTTPSVGAAAAEAVNITFMARTASSAATFLTGRAVPEVIADRAFSQAEVLQAFRLESSQIGGLVS